MAALWMVVLAGMIQLIAGAPDALSLNDAFSLMGFKSQIWNDPYASMSTWKVDPAVGHACFWTGIKCADLTAYRVSSVMLTGVSLYGPIGANLGSLTELRSLNLSHNGLTGAIPAALGQCTKLTVLDLSYNSLSAVIPPELGSLIALQKVYLGYNQFVGTLLFPALLTALTELSVEHNSFNGYPLDSLLNLNNLQVLNLGFNTFSGVIDSNDLTHFNSTLRVLMLGSNLFQGPMPSTFSYLTGLEKVDFGNNNISGSVPMELQDCANLQYINMSYNQLNGSIPAVYSKLQSLSVLDLRGNNIVGGISGGILACGNLTDLRLGDNLLNGSVPSGLTELAYLSYLDLSNNNFTGSVPDELASLPLKTVNLSFNHLTGSLRDFGPSLVLLDLSNNNFTGAIPAGYGSLPNLQTLSLAANQLTGEIPADLGKYVKLKVFNISGNRLTGRIPSGLAYANLSVFSVSSNMLWGEIADTYVMRQFSPDGFLPGNPLLCGNVIGRNCPTKPFPRWAAALLGTFLPIVVAGLAALLLLWLFPHGEFPPKTLRAITDDFNNSNLIGIGGASAVYKGVLPDGRNVAVKRLRPDYYSNKASFDLERKLLLDVKHPNVAQVLGFCSSGGLKALVLEHVPNGNLDMHLHEGDGLPWNSRMDIAAGVAQGMAYLHGEWQSPGPLHCDLKGSSVLLDEKLQPKITDIRLASSTSTLVSDSTLAGSIGYMPPEYSLSPGPTRAGDVYRYGSLMLELLTGVKPDGAIEGGVQSVVRQQYPHNLESVIDPQIWSGPFNDQIAMCTKIALLCTNDLANERPNMQDVLQMFSQVYEKNCAASLARGL